MTPIELSTRRRVTGLTSDEFARLFVSLQREVDGEAAGYAILSRSFSSESGSPICWIEELYIRKAYRGHGLGTKFLSSVRKEFPSARLRLEVEPENAGAAALYERLGFTPLEYVSYVVEPDAGIDAGGER